MGRKRRGRSLQPQKTERREAAELTSIKAAGEGLVAKIGAFLKRDGEEDDLILRRDGTSSATPT